MFMAKHGQIVGDDSPRIRESMERISHCKTSLEFATAHKSIPGEVGTAHIFPEFKRNH
jgi:hypothetical protein